MEAVEEPAARISSYEGDKDNNLEEIQVSAVTKITDNYHETNGVIEDPLIKHNSEEPDAVINHQTQSDLTGESTEVKEISVSEESLKHAVEGQTAADNSIPVPSNDAAIYDEHTVGTNVEISNDINVTMDATNSLSHGNVSFETEVLVEQEEMVNLSEDFDESNAEADAKTIFSQLEGENIDINEALASSTVIDTAENNNSTIRQQVFNKEQLLDILEGNDLGTTRSDNEYIHKMESQLALEQLTQLKKKRLKNTRTPIKSIGIQKGGKKNVKPKKADHLKDETSNQEEKSASDSKAEHNREKKVKTSKKNDKSKGEIPLEDAKVKLPTEEPKVENKLLIEQPKEEDNNIVHSLVKDWDDEEDEVEKAKKLLEETENLINASIKVTSTEDNNIDQPGIVNSAEIDSPAHNQRAEVLTKSSPSIEESQPNRRLSRVIKKKVIFDPDNPDTFTKGKTPTKLKEPQAPSEPEKEEPSPVPKKVKPDTTVQSPVPKKLKSDLTVQSPVPKKVKPELTSPSPRDKSKSPLTKQQWKKPAAKTNKNNKRLSEVDKLLMDEGAVNMIYQLTPEASKGKKNTRTKAELIKKINQSSTPESNEMKFRERKSAKVEDGEAKKSSGKHGSVSGSVKSMSVCEDFETHSADDSIIYRRHSSSSYSSACMSPRHLSDFEQQKPKLEPENGEINDAFENGEKAEDVFMANSSPSTKNIIRKEDCLSLKEKLNSKLSNVLNKRKRETTKTDKPAKQKKKSAKSNLVKGTESTGDIGIQFQTLSLTLNNKVAEICIKPTGSHNNAFDVQVLNELEKVLEYVDTEREATVTLLTSEFSSLCPALDLRPLLNDSLEARTNYAFELAGSIRRLLVAMEQHSKLLVCGVSGESEGLGLGMALMCDVILASERAGFLCSSDPSLPVSPGLAVLTTNYRGLPRNLITELVVFGRRVCAAEALAGGAVARVLPAQLFAHTARAIARDLAAQHTQTTLLKKRLLNLKATSERDSSTFHACLITEQDLFVEYWTSVEGQELLRAALQ